MSGGGTLGEIRDEIEETAEGVVETIEDVVKHNVEVAGLDDAYDLVVDTVIDIIEDIVPGITDIIDFGGDKDDDPTVPTIVNTKYGTIGEVSKISGVPVVYGTRHVRGITVFKELITETENGNITDEDWYVVYVLSEGEIDGVEGVWVDGVFIQSGANNDVGYVLNKSGFDSTWNLNKGTDNSVPDSFGFNYWWNVPSLSWSTNANDKLKAIANVQWRFGVKVSQVGQNINLPKVAFKVRGVKVRDNTGAVAYSSNPAWILRDYLTDSLYGVGIDDSEIDLPSFNTAADICDQINSGTNRHECNIILDSSKPVMNNVKRILKTCSGQLLWISGKYQMKIDDTLSGSVAMAFDTTNIIGGIGIIGESKQNKANQVTATFIDPDNDWQPTTVSWPDKILDASTYTQFLTTEDNGVPMKHKTSLGGVTDYNQARFIVQQACLRSRNNLIVSFLTTAEAVDLVPADIISITHSTPGWTTKNFIVRSVALYADGSVKLGCSEYQASTYTWNQAEAPAIVPDTSLPDPKTVSSPSDLVITETIYSAIASGGVKIRLALSWTHTTNYFVEEYEFEWQAIHASSWNAGGKTRSTQALLDDFGKGIHHFRVRAINSVGTISSWSYKYNYTVIGLSEPPADVVNFSLVALNDFINLSWDAPTDLDVKIGGYIKIRFSKLTTGVNWVSSQQIGERVPSTSTSTLLPLMDGTYLAKWVDSEGNESLNEVSSTTTIPGLRRMNVSATKSFDPDYDGTFVNLLKIAELGESNKLQFDSTVLWDSFTGLMEEWYANIDSAGDLQWDYMVGNIDSWGTIDNVIGGLHLSGEYITDSYDLGSDYISRIHGELGWISFYTGEVDWMDSWDLIEERLDWDERPSNLNLETWIRTTHDNPASSPTWTDYQRFVVADYKARGFQFKIKAISDRGDKQFNLTGFDVDFDMPDRTLGEYDIESTSVTYPSGQDFYITPALAITAKGMVSGDYYTISSETKSGFSIAFYNSSNAQYSASARKFNYLAKGY